MNKLELQAYRLVKHRFKMNRQQDLIKVNKIIFLFSSVFLSIEHNLDSL